METVMAITKNREKECPICGIFFTVTRSNQKYCPACRVNSGNKKAVMENAIKRSIRQYGTGAQEKPREKHCTCCGNAFIRPMSGGDDRFCSDKCKVRYIIEHKTCIYCGKLLIGTGLNINPYQKQCFCSPECELEYRKVHDEIFTCQICGKTVMRSGGGRRNKYCGPECAEKGRKLRVQEWAAEKNRQRKANTVRQEVCSVCKKIYLTSETKSLFCSERCHRVFFDRIEHETAIAEAKKEEFARSITYPAGFSLCADCHTPYKECERMASHFCETPEGAVLSDGEIVSCPKYKK